MTVFGFKCDICKEFVERNNDDAWSFNFQRQECHDCMNTEWVSYHQCYCTKCGVKINDFIKSIGGWN